MVSRKCPSLTLGLRNTLATCFADEMMIDDGKTETGCEPHCNLAIAAMDLFAAPAIEVQIGDCQAAVDTDEGRPRVTAPPVVYRNVPNPDVLR